jgi:choline monooxygenase
MTTKPLHPLQPLHLDVNQQIECAHTLASRFYTDPHILEIEQDKIFRRTWQLVGTLDQPCDGSSPDSHSSSLPSEGERKTENGVPLTAGSLRHEGHGARNTKKTISDPETFFTTEVAGEPVIVVRDKQGTLRAFSNVCRHRAGPIALGSGCKNVLRCQYHGWTYTLDGRLIGTPDVDGVEFFDRTTMGMVPLRSEVWEDFIFVNFERPVAGDQRPVSGAECQAELHTAARGVDVGGRSFSSDIKSPSLKGASAPEELLSIATPTLADVLGKIPELARGFQFAGLQLAERRDYVINCNWKVYVDNYLEGYHIPIAHPGLMREIDYSQYRTDTYRYYSQQFAPIRAMKPADSGERFYAPGTGLQEALYFWIFPNLMLNIYPDNISTNVIVPLGVDKTLTIFEWFFHDIDSPKTKERIAKAVAFSDEVQQEDILLCENVQKGLRSSTYDRGRYSVKRENGVHHFHMLLAEFIGEQQRPVPSDPRPVPEKA